MIIYHDANNKDIAAHIVYARPFADIGYCLYDDEAGNVRSSSAKLKELFLNDTLLISVWDEDNNKYNGLIKPYMMEISEVPAMMFHDFQSRMLPEFDMIMWEDGKPTIIYFMCMAEE